MKYPIDSTYLKMFHQTKNSKYSENSPEEKEAHDGGDIYRLWQQEVDDVSKVVG